VQRSQAFLRTSPFLKLANTQRDVLRSSGVKIEFVFLQGSEATLVQRIANRAGHFMPAS
jgi:gluconate kinase